MLMLKFNEDDLKKYCTELRNTNNWGGQLEIQAICNSLALPITIHTADAPGIKIFIFLNLNIYIN